MCFIYIGKKPAIRRLRLSAVPSIFPWTKQESESSNRRKARAAQRESERSKVHNICRRNLEKSFIEDDGANIEIQEVISEAIISEDRENDAMFTQEHFEKATQTPNKPMFDVENFVNDNAGMHFYTGLETYDKFLFVLRTLGPLLKIYFVSS